MRVPVVECRQYSETRTIDNFGPIGICRSSRIRYFQEPPVPNNNVLSRRFIAFRLDKS